jgi:hypothetical protein
MVMESILLYARRIRELRLAGPTNLEQALAPAFQKLLEEILPLIASSELVVLLSLSLQLPASGDRTSR